MMVDGAGVELQITPADAFFATGPLHQRVRQFANTYSTQLQLSDLPACQITTLSAPPDHVGLGVGTQLGLAVAAGLSEWHGLHWRDATLLCQRTSRGRRSAIGTHGFLCGGLLVDGGKFSSEPLGQLAARVELPTAWRFVLIRPPAVYGLAGREEASALASLPPIQPNITSNSNS